MLHRDLKPTNVLILSSKDGGKERIKVADFGSSSLLEPSRLKALGITSLGSTQTTDHLSQSLAGTFLYLAPELLSGSVATAAADVYSLGIILYQLVIGDFRKPLSAGWERTIEDPLIREDIATAASGDPAWRFATAAELAHRLCSLEDRRCIETGLFDKGQNRQKGSGRSRLKTRWRRPWIVLTSLAVMLTLAVFRFCVQSSEPNPLLNSVAILPFQNVGSEHALDFLSQAVPDEIATSLSYTRSLAVRPSVETGKYTQSGLDVQYVGNQLKVASIITGHFIQETSYLRLTIEAINVKTGRVFWRDTFTVPARSMIEMRQALIDRTQGALGAALGASALTSDAGTHPTNEEAYYLYLRAAAVPMDTAVNKETIAMLEKSVGLDPDFSSSWLMLGRRYYLEGRYANGGSTMMRHFQTSIERAIALDPSSIAAAANLTVLHLEQGELTKALREGEDLVRRRPDSADAHHILGAVFRYAGLLEDSSRECELAFRLDPYTQTAGLRSCAIVFSLRGKYDRAKDYLNLDPNSDFHKAILLTTLLREGRTREALQVGTPKIPQWQSYDMLPICEQNRSTSGLHAAAANLHVSQDPEANYLAAANLAYCGLTDQAMPLLKRAVERNYCSYPARDSDPFLASLRMLPQFAVIRKAGLACQQNFIAVRRSIEEQRLK